jgi:hypothetical protein
MLSSTYLKKQAERILAQAMEMEMKEAAEAKCREEERARREAEEARIKAEQQRAEASKRKRR